MEYEQYLREKEQSFGPTYTTLFPLLPCWFLEEVAYTYYAMSTDKTNAVINPCAELDYGTSCTYDALGADKTKFDDCMAPVIQAMGMSENIIEDLQAVKDGHLDPAEWFKLMGLDGPNPHETKANIYKENLASFQAIEQHPDTNKSECPCLCLIYEMGGNVNHLGTCDQSDVGTSVGHLCEFVNAARYYGMIDTSHCNQEVAGNGGIFQRRRRALQQNEDENENKTDDITEHDCLTVNGEKYCKPGKGRQLTQEQSDRKNKKFNPIGSRRHLQSLPIFPGRTHNRSLQRSVNFSRRMTTARRTHVHKLHQKKTSSRNIRREQLKEKLRPKLEEWGFSF